MPDRVLRIYVATRVWFAFRVGAAQRGEGVISTAIAVLIISLLGAAMWAAFKTVFDGATDNVGSAVGSIGG